MFQHIDLARISLLQTFPFEANARKAERGNITEEDTGSGRISSRQ
ncbi:hypothetical protein [Mesorhizobium xinjiangense]|nr:hypothetical protein [Mesorhizobium xinjiangense]